MNDFDNLIDNFCGNFLNGKSLAQLDFGVPQNIIQNEDGSWTIEIAVVGLTKDDLKIESKVIKNALTLVVENVKDAVEDKKTYIEHRIKLFKKASWTISSDLDLTKLTAKVANGLLTINIPAATHVQPTSYTID